jgi:hypothetical protein
LSTARSFLDFRGRVSRQMGTVDLASIPIPTICPRRTASPLLNASAERPLLAEVGQSTPAGDEHGQFH